MRIIKKLGLTFGLLSLVFAGALKANMVSAVSDKAIEIHEKAGKLADLAIDYYAGESTQDASGLGIFISKLNERQLEIFKNSFRNHGFPKFLDSELGVNLSISISGINLLVDAVRSGDLELVKLIIENFNISDINATDDCGCGSPLWCAVCLAGEEGVDDKTVVDMVDYLLSIGANPYTEYGKGYVPTLFEKDSNFAPRMILKETFGKYGYYQLIQI